MVQIAENWADVVGVLLDHYPSKTNAGFVTLEIKVERLEGVEGYRNLLEGTEGEVIYVNVPEAVSERLELRRGAKISCRVRKADPRKLFVHPEQITIEK